MNINEISIDTHNLNLININDCTNNKCILKELLEKIKEICQLVFNTLGTGFSEYIYHRALELELRHNSIIYESKKIIPIFYKDINIGYGEVDILIHLENKQKIVLELKAISNSPREIEIAQVHTYLNSIKESVFGVVINFPQPSTKKAKEIIDVVFINKKSLS